MFSLLIYNPQPAHSSKTVTTHFFSVPYQQELMDIPRILIYPLASLSSAESHHVSFLAVLPSSLGSKQPFLRRQSSRRKGQTWRSCRWGPAAVVPGICRLSAAGEPDKNTPRQLWYRMKRHEALQGTVKPITTVTAMCQTDDDGFLFGEGLNTLRNCPLRWTPQVCHHPEAHVLAL